MRYCVTESGFVACFGPRQELDRVRESFLKKKLGLSGDAELDEAVKSVMSRMKADRSKSRVTVYYLLAEQFGKLSSFVNAAKARSSSDAARDRSAASG